MYSPVLLLGTSASKAADFNAWWPQRAGAAGQCALGYFGPGVPWAHHAEQIQSVAKVQITHIPYKAAASR